MKEKRIFSEEHRKNISLSHKGKPKSPEHRRKLSEAMKGDKSVNWKGGVTSIYKQIRKSVEYKLWREAIFKRDDFTCVWCRKKGIYLEPDHIQEFAYYPKLRFAIDNGRTLCQDCHRKRHGLNKK